MIHCPNTGIDESHYVCSPLQQKILTVIGTAATFIGAFGIALYVIRVKVTQLRQEIKTRNENLTENEKAQLQNAFCLLITYQKDPNQPNEESITKVLKKFSLEMKMALMKIVYITEVKEHEDHTESLFKQTVRLMLTAESLRKAHLTYVKGYTKCTVELKIKIFEAIEPLGCLGNLGLRIQGRCSQSAKAMLQLVKRVLGSLIMMAFIPWQDAKDIITIVSLQLFHHDVIQDRIELIDNLPLQEFIQLLSIIYGFALILRLMNACSTASPEDRSHSCYLDIFRCSFNPYWIPFVREIVIAIQKIQKAVSIYKATLTLNQLVEKLETDRKTETWSEILDVVQDIEQAKLNLENLDNQKRQIKTVSILGDILQGSILIIMLLRPDLRLRSFFEGVSVSGSLGINLKKLGTLGIYAHLNKNVDELSVADSISLDLLLAWNLVTPSFRLRGLLSGHKQGLFTRGGLLHAFALAMSLTCFVITSVMLGYQKVFLIPVTPVVLGIITFITKSALDSSFRKWSLGPKLSHCLLASIFPISSPRPETKVQKFIFFLVTINNCCHVTGHY